MLMASSIGTAWLKTYCREAFGRLTASKRNDLRCVVFRLRRGGGELTDSCQPVTTPLCGARSQTDFGPNREHGEDDPIGAETVTAPATVSGEGFGSIGHWETGKAAKVQRPASQETCHAQD